MSPLVSLTAFLLLIAQVNTPDLEEALRAMEGAEGGVATDIAFTPDVGAAAAHALGTRATAMAPDELENHMQVALRGNPRALAPHLGRLLAVDGPALSLALRAAGELGAKERPLMLAALGTAATRPSISFAWGDEDEKVARGAIAVLVGAGEPPAVQDLLQTLARDELLHPRAAWALQVIADLEPSTELVALLIDIERDLPPALHATLASALVTFIDQEPALLSPPIVEAIQTRPSPAFLGAAIAMPPDQWEATISGIMFVITELSPQLTSLQGEELDLFVAAINAAADLRAAELLPLLPELCRPTSPMPIRLAGLRALGELGAKEASIIDQLLIYLPEKGPIADAAFASLRLRAGARLPLRLPMWQDWRQRTKLVVMTTEEHTQRLQDERQARYDARGGGQRLNSTRRPTTDD